MTSRIITAQEALERGAAGEHIVYLDARSLPGKPSLRPEYEQGHIPGAHFVELTEHLQTTPSGFSGNRPLPTVGELQANVERWGIRDDSLVVVYSNGTHGAAARAWFVLTWAGHPNVRFLDGGLDAWSAAGGAVSTEEPVEGGGTFSIAEAGHLPVLTADDVQDALDAGRPVLDARKATKFTGEEADDEGNVGHIPGAVSLPAGKLVAKDGTLRPAAEVAGLLVDAGVTPGDTIAVYCGGGVAGALETLVLGEHGYDTRLFVGSFSAWASDPSRQVAATKKARKKRAKD